MKYCADCILKQFPPCDKGIPCCKCDEFQCNSRQPCQWKDERLSNAGMFACRNDSCPAHSSCARWLKYKQGAFWGGVFSCHKDADRCKHFVDKDAKDE